MTTSQDACAPAARAARDASLDEVGEQPATRVLDAPDADGRPTAPDPDRAAAAGDEPAGAAGAGDDDEIAQAAGEATAVLDRSHSGPARLPPGVRPLEDGAPDRVGPYRLLARIGTGSMGRVYLGQQGDGRLAAVKLVRPDLADEREFRDRFRHEITAASRVHGPGIAEVLDADVDAAPPWLATAYVDGPSLRQAVAAHGPLRPASVARLARGVAEALAAIHAAGVVHRDLKPANVLLGSDGPRVIDFGIARGADTTHVTATGLVVGTPAFMAPEQALGQDVGAPADVFSLGATLVFAACGTTPFGRGAPSAVLWRVIHDAPELAGVDDEALRALIACCLVKDPARRPDARRLLAHLDGELPLDPPAEALLARPQAPRAAAAVPPPTGTVALPVPRPSELHAADTGGSSPSAPAGDGPGHAAPRPPRRAADPGRRRPQPLGVVLALAAAAAIGVGLAAVGVVSSSTGATPPNVPAGHSAPATTGDPTPAGAGAASASTGTTARGSASRPPTPARTPSPTATTFTAATSAPPTPTTGVGGAQSSTSASSPSTPTATTATSAPPTTTPTAHPTSQPPTSTPPHPTTTPTTGTGTG